MPGIRRLTTSLNRGNLLSATASGFWMLPKLMGAGGLLPDISGKGDHGVLTGGALWAPSVNGMAVQFDGSNDYVQLGYTSKAAMVLSVSAEIKPTSLDYRTILGWNDTAGPQFRITPSGQLEWVSQGTANIGTGTGGVVAGVSSFVTAAYDSSTGVYRFWVNGVGKGSGTNAKTLTAGRRANIGMNNPGANFEPWLGTIGVAMIHETLFTDAEAGEVYQQWLRGFPDMSHRPRHITYSIPTGGGGGVSVPKFYYHYQQQGAA